MAIAVRAVGTVAAGTAAVTPGLPAGTVYADLLIMFIETFNEAITAAGWTQAPGSPVSDATDLSRLTVLYRWAEGTAPATVTSDSGNHQIARIIGFSGCGPWDNVSPFSATASSNDTVSNTSAVIPGVTTVLANQMMVYACGTTRDVVAGTAQYTTWVNAALASADERIDNTTDVASGGTIGVATGIKVAAGAAGNMTVTLGAASRKTYWSAALVPQVAAPTKPEIGRRDFANLVPVSMRPIVGWTPAVEHAGLYLRPPLLIPAG